MNTRHRAYAYVTHEDRLLLFTHPESPEAGIQVPAGTVDPGEEPQDAVMREARQETGIEDLEYVAMLGHDTRDMSDFGMQESSYSRLVKAIESPYGMVLVTGPTGSGKTTTLYSALSRINLPGVNIMTAEDPVEYNIDGINQIQINEGVGMTFANALRAFLRQDPNIVLVGEIRDIETGSVAVKAALTGHLVLSTLHTNDAATATTRLVDMGVEPFLVASTVIGVMAQRLVRCICSACREEFVPQP